MSLNLILTPVAMAQTSGGSSGGEEDNFVGCVPTAGVDCYTESGTASKGGYDFYAKQILQLATSAIGSSIFTQCLSGFKVPSIATFMGGSLVHIGGEIASGKATNEKHKQKIKDLKMLEEKMPKGGGEYQKEALLQAKKDEEDTLSFLKKRRNWMIAVTTIYSAAAGLAIGEEISGRAAATAAGVGVCTSTCSASTVAAAGCVPGCKVVSSTGIATAVANHIIDTAPAVGATQCSATTMFAPACLAELNTYLGMNYAACTRTPPTGAISWGTALSMAYGFAQGQLDGGAISQYGSMIIPLVTTIIPSLGQLVVPMYNFPIPRSITFGAAGVISGAITIGLNRRINVAKDNIAKLDKVIAQFKVQTNDPTGTEEDPNLPGSDEDPMEKLKNKNYDVKELPKVADKKSCIGKNGDSFVHSEQACSNPVKLKTPTFDYKHGISTLNNVGTKAIDMANAIASGDMGKADMLAGEIGAQAAAVKDINDKLQDKYNEQQKAEKKEPKDFDKAIAAQVASLQRELNKAAASQGMNLADLGKNELSEELEAKSDSQQVTVASTDSTIPMPEIPSMDLSGIGSGSGFEDPSASAATPTLEDSLGDYESNEQDISKQNDVSIFKQLSNRYILNYTKIFDRKKAPAPVAENNKN